MHSQTVRDGEFGDGGFCTDSNSAAQDARANTLAINEHTFGIEASGKRKALSEHVYDVVVRTCVRTGVDKDCVTVNCDIHCRLDCGVIT